MEVPRCFYSPTPNPLQPPPPVRTTCLRSFSCLILCVSFNIWFAVFRVVANPKRTPKPKPETTRKVSKSKTFFAKKLDEVLCSTARLWWCSEWVLCCEKDVPVKKGKIVKMIKRKIFTFLLLLWWVMLHNTSYPLLLPTFVMNIFHFFKKNGPNPASFCLFLFFSHDKYSTSTINEKKCRWCTWNIDLQTPKNDYKLQHDQIVHILEPW